MLMCVRVGLRACLYNSEGVLVMFEDQGDLAGYRDNLTCDPVTHLTLKIICAHADKAMLLLLIAHARKISRFEGICLLIDKIF